MSHFLRPLPADFWMQQIFEAKSARTGGVVRRKMQDIERNVGKPQFEAELIRRGYHAVQNGDQVVIFCNNQHIQIIC